MGGTGEAAEGCDMLTKLSLAPAHSAPRAHWHPRSWQITAPSAGPEEAGGCQAGGLDPCPADLPELGKAVGGTCQVTPVKAVSPPCWHCSCQ